MKVKTIFIHVGAGKTGTSALQSFLSMNLERLAESGLYVPLVGAVENQKYIAHHFLSGTSRFSSEDPFEAWRAIAELKNEKVLISSEVLHNRITQDDGVAFFESVKEILNGWTIRVIFYVRREDDWLESVYAQWIKSGTLRTGETFSDFARRYRPKLAKQIKLFESLFGKSSLIVRPFKRDTLINRNIVDDFFNVIDHEIPEGAERPAGDVNTRLPVGFLDFKRVYNSICADQQQAQLINGDLFALGKMLSHGASDTHTLTKGLTTEEQQRLRLRCEKSFDDLYNEFPQLATLFDDRAEDEAPDARAEPCPDEDDRLIIAFLMRRLYQRISMLESAIKAGL